MKLLTGLLLSACMLAGCAAPIVPQRTKPGGAARWAEAIALDRALRWSKAAKLCRISGTGIGTDGWLPDRGGAWVMHYWSEEKPLVLAITVDSNGQAREHDIQDPSHGRTLPRTWHDSPKIWSTTRRRLTGEPVNTFDADLAYDAEPERYPGRAVWRIRFWMEDNTYETHVVGADAEWLTSY